MAKPKEFLFNMLKGGAIGVAMIIPGVSGGTIAVLMGVYDKIIGSIGGFFKDVKNNLLFLLPIVLGAVLALAALYYPMKYALEYALFPTIMLFAGFMLGSCPDLICGAKKDGFKKFDVASVLIPFIVVIGICFIPNMGEADLSVDMPATGYLLLILMGILASCALVVPGISGSMLMLIFGYYKPLLGMVSMLRTDFGHALLVLVMFAIGVIIGFFTISKLMQLLLNKFHRSTMWAIIGFVLGSIPAVLIVFFTEDGGANIDTLNALQISLGVVAFIVGGIATFFLARFAAKRNERLFESAEVAENETENANENAVEETPTTTEE